MKKRARTKGMRTKGMRTTLGAPIRVRGLGRIGRIFAVVVTVVMVCLLVAGGDAGSVSATSAFGMNADATNERTGRGPVETVPRIRVNNLGRFKGQYLTAFYVFGTGGVTTSAAQVHVNDVKGVTGPVKITEEAVELPAVEISKVGITHAYSHILLVVHDTPDCAWKNADGSMPIDPRAMISDGACIKRKRIKSVIRAEIISHQKHRGDSAVFVADFAKR